MKMGFQGGGPTWAGIVHGLVKLKRLEVFAQLRFDEEGDGLALWSSEGAFHCIVVASGAENEGYAR